MLKITEQEARTHIRDALNDADLDALACMASELADYYNSPLVVMEDDDEEATSRPWRNGFPVSKIDEVSDFDKANVGHCINEGDWWTCQFWRLLARSDPERRNRLYDAFPEHVQVFEDWKNS